MSDCCSSYFWISLVIVAFSLYKIIPKIILQRKLDRWNKSKCPKDVVVLHGVPRSKTVPAASPFVLKLETFLRMADIPYQYDSKNPFGPKGKTPWISLNGEHVADSQVCIEYLSKKHGINMDGKYSAKELAIGSFVQNVLEDRSFWQIAMWAFVWGGEGRQAVQRFMKIPYIIMLYLGHVYGKAGWSQGIARHSKEQIEAWTIKDIRNIAAILGKNKYLLGDEPCVFDAAFFGFAAQFFLGISILITLWKTCPR